jgi:pilus assembly protein CpaC
MKTQAISAASKSSVFAALAVQGNAVSHQSMKSMKSTPPTAHSALALCLCAAWQVTSAQGLPAFSQSANQAGALTTTPADPVNGYAENLKPTKGKSASAGYVKTAVVNLPNLPYAPIRKLDDEGQTAEIEMFVGESRVFPAPGVARIAVGNGSLLTAAALDSKEVILFANGVGTSSLFIWNADGRYQRVKISIVPGDTSKHAREIAAFLSSIPRAKASIVGANIIVEGDELSDADLAKVDDLSKRYPQIVNFTNRVGWEQMIMMDVKVVEFPTTVLRDIGMQWNPTGGAAIGGIWSPARRGSAGPFEIGIRTGSDNAPPITGAGGLPLVIPSGLNAISYLNLGLNAQLNLLAQDGKASILAEPQLSARSGSKAKFVSGGEIPYSVRTNEGIVVQFKSYGIKLDITPKVDHRGVIRASVMAEVSSIDKSVSTAGGPALLSRRTETEFNVRAGETIVLSGLLTREVSTDVDKVPLLGDLPFIGTAFRSTRQQNKETELVVFVTPTLVQANSPGNLDRIQKTNERLQERMGPAPFITEPLQPGVSYEKPNALPVGSATLIAPVAVAPAAAEPKPVQVPVAEPQALLGVRASQQIKTENKSAAPSKAPGLPASTAASGSAKKPASHASKSVTGPRSGNDFIVHTDGTELRVEPGGGTVLLVLDRGVVANKTALEPHTTAGKTWRRVTVDGLTGWVNNDALSVLNATHSATHSAAASAASILAVATGPDRAVRPPLLTSKDPAQTKALTLDRANADARRYRVSKGGMVLRITPDVNGEVVSRATEGDTLALLPHPARGIWTAVQLGDGDNAKRGWVVSQALKNAAP